MPKKPPSTTSRPRLDWIDVAKGYGIIMVIMGHLYFPAIYPYFYTFHLPLFFFLSGYVFRLYASWREFTRRKVRSLLVPYFVSGLLMIGFYFVYTVGGKNFTWDSLSWHLQNLLIQRRFWTIWFLPCLFLVEMIFYLLARLLPRERARLASVVLLTALGYAYICHAGQPLPWNADAALMALPFFYAGHVYRRLHLPVCRRHQWWAWLILAAGVVIDVCCLQLTRRLGFEGLEFFRLRFAPILLTYTGAFAGIAACVVWSQFFTPAFIRYLGRHSLFIFCYHQKVFLPVLTDFLLLIFAQDAAKTLLFQVTLLVTILITMAVFSRLGDFLRTYGFKQPR